MEFELGGKRPSVHPDAYIAPTAVLIGDVDIGAGASVWFGAVLRADEAQIKVGAGRKGRKFRTDALDRAAQGTARPKSDLVALVH